MTAAQRGTRLATSSLYNLLGQGAPFLAAVVAIPLLLHGMGTDRFGVLTLAWVVIGYFGVLDLGLSRALTQVVAEHLATDADARATPVAWLALLIMAALGLVATLVVCLSAPWLVWSVLKIPPALRVETVQAFYLLATIIPFAVLTAGLAGILTAFQRFGLLNAIRAPMYILSFLAPLAILPFTHSLPWITAGLVAGRVLGCLGHFLACLPLMAPVRSAFSLSRAAIKPLFRLGAWITVSNVISPLMQYLDRFVIGAILSVAAVAYYATPYEVITKVGIVSGAVSAVLFPAFASSYRQDRQRLVMLFVRGTKYLALILFPVLLVAVAVAPEILTVWLGADFARHSAAVLQVLAIGVFMNGPAQIFVTLIQGVGRPDLTAKLHLAEIMVYPPALWWGIHHFGILGAAAAWSARMAVDSALMFMVTARLLHADRAPLVPVGAGLALALAGLAAPALLPVGAPVRIAVASLELVVFLAVAWAVVVGRTERATIRAHLGFASARDS